MKMLEIWLHKIRQDIFFTLGFSIIVKYLKPQGCVCASVCVGQQKGLLLITALHEFLVAVPFLLSKYW